MNEQNPSTFAEGDFGTLFVADRGFADDSSASPYKNTGIHPCYGGGYVSAFGWSEEFDWMFIPAEKNGNSSLPLVITIGTEIPAGGLLYWAVFGVTVLVRVLSIGIWLMLLLIVIGMSAGGWCMYLPKRQRKH